MNVLAYALSRSSSPQHRVDSEQTGSRCGVDDLVQTNGRSIRHPIQPPAPNLCVSCSRSVGLGHGRPVDPLEGLTGGTPTIRFPSFRRAHEVRSIATSVAFQYSLSLKDVLEATYWCSVGRSSIHPRAQEVRSIAISVAFHYSLPSRMSLRLRSENPFINFYLRDFRAKRADGTKGISFVAASVPVTFPRPARSGH
ncbi:hypothetical protein ACOMHN_039159 [Nucella lapillus]